MNKIEKLELKHICGYLPWGLTGCHKEGHICNIDFDMVVKYGINLANYKPLLLPLSALTEQLPDGSIPIVELAEIHDNNLSDERYCTITNENDEDGRYFMVHYSSYIHEDISCHFVVTDECVFQANALFHNSTIPKYETISVNNQLQLFEYLFANHFDIYGLIDAGLAIDKRTVKL